MPEAVAKRVIMNPATKIGRSRASTIDRAVAAVAHTKNGEGLGKKNKPIAPSKFTSLYVTMPSKESKCCRLKSTGSKRHGRRMAEC